MLLSTANYPAAKSISRRNTNGCKLYDTPTSRCLSLTGDIITLEVCPTVNFTSATKLHLA